MNKIERITENSIFVSTLEGNIEVSINELNFTPKAGMEVEVVKTGDSIKINRIQGIDTITSTSNTNNKTSKSGLIAPKGTIYDHTDKYESHDISLNKLLAILNYILGPFGLLLGLVASTNSKYLTFHTRQNVKVMVLSTLIYAIAGVLCMIITIIGSIFVALFDNSIFIVLSSITNGLIVFSILTLNLVVLGQIIYYILKGKVVEPLFYRAFQPLR